MSKGSVGLVVVLVLGMSVAGCVGNTDVQPDDGEDVETAQAGSDGQAASLQLQRFTWSTSHDFMNEDPDEVTFEVPERAYAEGLVLHFTGPPPQDAVNVCAGMPSAQITLQDPSGETVRHASVGLAISTGIGCGPSSTMAGTLRLAPGTWTVVFEGQGLVTGHVDIG